MAEDTGDKGEGKFRINFSPDSLRKFLHAENKSESGLYAEVSRHSRDYADSLGLDGNDDTELMERKQGRLGMYPSGEDYLAGAVLKLDVDGRSFGIIVKNTACHDYGESAGWRHLIMAVSGDPSLNKSAGYGTAWINSVPEEWHKKILEAVNQSGKNDDLSGELFNFLKK